MSATPTLSPRTCRAAEQLFAPAAQGEVLRLLEESSTGLPMVRPDDLASLERLHLAMLKVSRGDLGRLRRAIELARVDWRDLLMAADFGHDTRAHLHWRPSPPPGSGKP